jgi:hypothetical protein
MSLEITLHPKKATRFDLSRLLSDLGYVRCGHRWNWPKGSLHYQWFGLDDYRSFDGIEATIYKPSDDSRGLGPCEWALHTRTRASGSPTDKNYQNETIRLARKAFGGSFYNDWQGKNRYSPFWEDPRDAASRGIYLTYASASDYISAIIFSISLTNDNFISNEEMANRDEFYEFVNKRHPMRIMYNALIPFCVSILENFFGNCFKILLRYDANAERQLSQSNKKIEIEDAIALRDGNLSVETLVSRWYSFQNISSIHKAYSEWLDIDFRKIIRTKRKFGKKIDLMENVITNIIDFRHGVIHRMEIDTSLHREKAIEVFEAVKIIIEEFVFFLESRRGKLIREETVYPEFAQNTGRSPKADGRS